MAERVQGQKRKRSSPVTVAADEAAASGQPAKHAALQPLEAEPAAQITSRAPAEPAQHAHRQRHEASAQQVGRSMASDAADQPDAMRAMPPRAQLAVLSTSCWHRHLAAAQPDASTAVSAPTSAAAMATAAQATADRTARNAQSGAREQLHALPDNAAQHIRRTSAEAPHTSAGHVLDGVQGFSSHADRDTGAALAAPLPHAVPAAAQQAVFQAPPAGGEPAKLQLGSPLHADDANVDFGSESCRLLRALSSASPTSADERAQPGHT